jgi:hypothetical protein
MEENAQMGDERLRSEIRDEQERTISAVRSATDRWEMAKAEDSFADLLEWMAGELEMGSAHDRGRFLAAAHALRQSAAVNEHRNVTGLSDSGDDAISVARFGPRGARSLAEEGAPLRRRWFCFS